MAEEVACDSHQLKQAGFASRSALQLRLNGIATSASCSVSEDVMCVPDTSGMRRGLEPETAS
jgi:hypothetical protein